MVHTQAVEFGSVTDDRKAHGTVQLVNKGSRKACFAIKWDADFPLVFTPSEVSARGVSGAWMKAKGTDVVGTVWPLKGSPCFSCIEGIAGKKCRLAAKSEVGVLSKGWWIFPR